MSEVPAPKPDQTNRPDKPAQDDDKSAPPPDGPDPSAAPVDSVDLFTLGGCVGATVLAVNTIRAAFKFEAPWLSLLIALAIAAVSYMILATRKKKWPPNTATGWIIAIALIVLSGFTIFAAAFGVNSGVNSITALTARMTEPGTSGGMFFDPWTMPW